MQCTMASISSVIAVLFLAVFANGNEEQESAKVLLCSLDITASRRKGPGIFTPEDLDPNLCTHIIYNKAIVDKTNHEIVPQDPETDLYEKGGQGMYNRTLKLKEINPNVKMILQIYCSKDSFWDNTTIPTSVIISKFIKNTVKYMQLYGFDGLHITPERTPDMLWMLTDLRVEFNKHGYTLITFIFPTDKPGVEGVQLTLENSEPFDLILVGKYWNWYGNKTKTFSSLTTLRRVISEYKDLGIPSEKLVVPIPTFATSYELCNDTDNELSAEVCGPGTEGRSGSPEMVLMYYELMQKMSNDSEGWVVTRDNVTGIMYGHSNSLLWTSYEDPVSVRAKVQYVLEQKLAGVAMMTVDMDDVVGYNEGGIKLPLTRAAYDALRGNHAEGHQST